ncbi:MAG: hypothetical protein RR988_05950 [Clostridia bacterium]
MNKKIFENKFFSKSVKLLKHLGIFFCAMMVFTICTLALPKQHVEVDYNTYKVVEDKEVKLSDEYTTANSEYETNKNELSEKKAELTSENEKIVQQINDINKELEELTKK